jgi:hypothetical protein
MTTIRICGRDLELPEREPTETPEERAWSLNVREGIGGYSDEQLADLRLAERVRHMHMNMYLINRRELGSAQPGTMDSLGGVK